MAEKKRDDKRHPEGMRDSNRYEEEMNHGNDNRAPEGIRDSNRYEEEMSDGGRTEYGEEERQENEVEREEEEEEVAVAAAAAPTIDSNMSAEEMSDLTNLRQEELNEEESDGEEKSDDRREIDEFERTQQIRVYQYLRRLYATEQLLSHRFLIIHINVFDEEWCVPAEVAINNFTIKDGLGGSATYHNILRTNLPPTSIIAERVRENSARTHNLLPSGGPINVHSIFAEVLNYIKKYSRSFGGYIIFAPPNNIKSVLKVMKHYGGDEYRNVHVFDVRVLFYHFKNMTFQESRDTRIHFDMTSQTDKLKMDKYCFKLDLACWYHRDINHSMYCSKANVDRIVFLICEDCCKQLGVRLVKGCHTPA